MENTINEQKKANALEKIRKLLMVTAENGSSETEVENALKAIQRLTMQYEIDQDEFTLSPLDIQIDELDNTFKSHEYRYWFFDVLGALSRSYSCRVIKKWRPVTGSYYRLVGTNADRTIVKNTFETLIPIMRNIEKTKYDAKMEDFKTRVLDQTGKELTKDSLKYYIKKKYMVSRKTHFNSYYKGFVYGLEQKLLSDKEIFLQLDENREKWGLIVVKKDAIIDQIVKEEFPNLKSHVTRTKIDAKTWHTGRKDGSDNDMSTKLNA